ncbi:MAG: hypothetical protein AAB821_03330 [Patescibacteria group bacterium]
MELAFTVIMITGLATLSVGAVYCVHFLGRQGQREILSQALRALRQESMEGMLEWMVKADVLAYKTTGEFELDSDGVLYLKSLSPLLGRRGHLLGVNNMALTLSSFVHSEKVDMRSIATTVLTRYPTRKQRQRLFTMMDKKRAGTGDILKSEMVDILDKQAVSQQLTVRASTLEKGLQTARVLAKDPRN